MNSDDPYICPIIKRLIAVLEADGPADLKGKYQYRPVFYGQGNDPLPVCMISTPVLRSLEFASGGLNKHIKAVELVVIADWTQEPVKWRTNSFSQLDQLIDPRDNNYKLTGGLLKVIQDNKGLDTAKGLTIAVDPNPEIIVNRELVINRRGQGIWSIEGSITFAVQLN